MIWDALFVGAFQLFCGFCNCLGVKYLTGVGAIFGVAQWPSG